WTSAGLARSSRSSTNRPSTEDAAIGPLARTDRLKPPKNAAAFRLTPSLEPLPLNKPATLPLIPELVWWPMEKTSPLSELLLKAPFVIVPLKLMSQCCESLAPQLARLTQNSRV